MTEEANSSCAGCGHFRKYHSEGSSCMFACSWSRFLPLTEIWKLKGVVVLDD